MNRLTAMILICAGVLTGCVAPGGWLKPAPTPEAVREKAEYKKLSPQQAKEMMEQSKAYILLDVRTEEEFRGQRIPGAILIPDYELGTRAAGELPDKEALILVYCRSGRRSALAAKGLIAMGYTKVYDFGGILDWPYETINGE